MTDTRLKESHDSRKGKALLVTEGLGSSGSYSAEVLQRDGASAFPAGSHLVLNHMGENENWERRGSRDIKDIVGVLSEAATWSEEDRGLVADIEIFPHAKEFVESVWEHTALSIEASGVVSDEGVVEALVYSPTNSVSLVPRGGRGGKIKGLYESYQEKYATISNDESPNGKEDPGMTAEEIKNAVKEAFGEFVPTLTTALTEALKPAEVIEKTDEGESTAVVAEAVAESKLPASARTKVYEAVAAGTPVADAIAAEQKYIEDVLKESETDESETPSGRVKESGGSPRRLNVWG